MESSASAGRVASAVLDPRRWWACGAFFMVLLDGTITIVALPSAPGADWGDVRTILPLAGSAVLVAAFVTTVAVSRSQHYLAAHKGANPLVR